MEKMFVIIGMALVSLGIGFLVVKELEPTLHFAFDLGGWMWTLIGAVTILVGLKIKREKTVKLGAV